MLRRFSTTGTLVPQIIAHALSALKGSKSKLHKCYVGCANQVKPNTQLLSAAAVLSIKMRIELSRVFAQDFPGHMYA
jgi:hypothetical protein